MSGIVRRQNGKKSSLAEILGMYLWLLPAVILVLFFLILPTFQTIGISLNQKVSFSMSEFTKEIISEFKTVSGSEVTKEDVFKKISGWEKVIQTAENKYKIKISESDINEEMTVNDTVQLLSAAIKAEQQKNGSGVQFVGLKNYVELFQDPRTMIALWNNLMWLIFFSLFTVGIGLGIAAFADKVKWSTVAKTIVFVPYAISFVASAVIWNFMYDKDVHIGTVNAVINILHKLNFLSGGNFEGIAFLAKPEVVTFALIAAAVWMQVGYCVVIFSAALKSVPVELVEMARIEGATNFQIFFKIEIPIIQSTIVVVTTTMVIWVLKVFDIIYALPVVGERGQVLASRMYYTAFSFNNFESAAAIAVVLFIAVLPVLVWNVRNLMYEESVRE